MSDVERIVCRVPRAERYDCGHVLVNDRPYDPARYREYAQVVPLTGPCPWCLKLASWKGEAP